ncbi:MAG: nitroreductase family protein [Lachnospiraceae bacterium]|nr:nitroreductase family protein [Lachnospiraceae bacterium]
MDALKCIKERRSIRKFTDEKIAQADVENLVEVARFAPTWKNSQSIRFVAVFDEAVKSKIAEDAVMGFEGNKNIINGAPALIIIATVDKRAGYERDGSFSTSKETHWQSFDAGIETEAFCLAAHEAGLGTVIMGIYDEDKVREIVKLPEGQSVSALVALGHPAEEPNAPKRKEVADLLTVI